MKLLLFIVLTCLSATASVSTPRTMTQVVLRASTVTAVIVSNGPVPTGSTETIAFAVSSSAGMPVGQVSLIDNSSTLATIPLINGNGSVEEQLPPGTHAITVCYQQSQNFAGSCSSSTSLVVTDPSVTPNFALSGGSPTATIVSGNTWTQTFTVIPKNGYRGEVQLACLGAPADSACDTSSQSVTLDGKSTVNATVKLKTNLNVLALSLFLPFLMVSAMKRRRNLMFSAVIGSMLLLVCSGCGVTLGPGTQGTHPGTYTLIVKATAGQETQQLTYHVQVTNPVLQ